VLTKEEIIKRLKENKEDLQKRFPIGNIALFGSYARGEETERSDIDILVEFNGPIGWEIVDLQEELEKIFTGCKIDLISKGGIKARMWPYIEDDLIYA
jgi:predicted nucleotidyltransferase